MAVAQARSLQGWEDVKGIEEYLGRRSHDYCGVLAKVGQGDCSKADYDPCSQDRGFDSCSPLT